MFELYYLNYANNNYNLIYFDYAHYCSIIAQLAHFRLFNVLDIFASSMCWSLATPNTAAFSGSIASRFPT